MRALALALSVSIVACGLFPTLDDLVGGADASGADVVSDASADGSDAHASYFCDGVDAEVCEDMDRDGAMSTWRLPAAVTFDAVRPSSPPLALSEVFPGDAGQCDYRQAQRPFPGSKSIVHVETDVWVGDSTGDAAPSDPIFLALSFQKNCLVWINANANGLDQIRVTADVTLPDGGVAPNTILAGASTPWLGNQVGRWRHLTLDVDWTASTVSWDYDGRGVAGGYGPLQGNLSVCKGATVTQLALGRFCSANAFAYRFDNVVVTRR